MNCWPKKLFQKIVTNRISRYALDHKFIRQEQFGFWKKKKKKKKKKRKECISLYISIRKICQRRKFKGNFTYLVFFLDHKKKGL